MGDTVQLHRITTRARVTGPFNLTPGAPYFVDGVAYTDDPAFLGYARTADGYTIEPVDQAPADYLTTVEQGRAAAVGRPERVGTPLRDAAVDPHPDDASIPMNAGLGLDPHGPEVVSPEALTREDQARAAGLRAEGVIA
jgi:hypothetical protein